jgi:hypothetical protein
VVAVLKKLTPVLTRANVMKRHFIDIIPSKVKYLEVPII